MAGKKPGRRAVTAWKELRAQSTKESWFVQRNMVPEELGPMAPPHSANYYQLG